MSPLHVDMTVTNAMSLFYGRLDFTGFLCATLSGCIGLKIFAKYLVSIASNNNVLAGHQ